MHERNIQDKQTNNQKTIKYYKKCCSGYIILTLLISFTAVIIYINAIEDYKHINKLTNDYNDLVQRYHDLKIKYHRLEKECTKCNMLYDGKNIELEGAVGLYFHKGYAMIMFKNRSYTEALETFNHEWLHYKYDEEHWK